jgi:glutathione S-transferase
MAISAQSRSTARGSIRRYDTDMPHRLKLISFDICPYVERARIVLLEKGLPHEIELIDLANKPAWFLEVSPMGRVPVLLVDDRPIFESMVIDELVNELQPDPPLFPRDPVARAEGRSWIVFANDVVMPAGSAAMLAIAGEERGEALARPLSALGGALGKLERRLARDGGPFFLGREFSLVDASYAPFLRRWRLAEGWGAEEARLLARLPRVTRWADAMLSRPSVRSAEPAELDAKSRRFYAERAARARAG